MTSIDNSIAPTRLDDGALRGAHRRRTRDLRRAFASALALAAFLSTTATAIATSLPVTVLSDFAGTVNIVSQARSLRGLSISPDNSTLYAGFIAGTSSAGIRTVDSSTGLYSSPVSTVNGSFYQAKGVTVDDRGNVYATLNASAGAKTQEFRDYTSALTNQTVSPTNAITTAANTQLAGASVAHIGDHYYLYLSHNKTGGQIERYNVDNPAVPFLDTTWATSGVLDLKVLTSNANAFVNGLEVTSDGTIYATGGLLSTGRGDTVFEIASNLTTWTDNTSVSGAMDLALYGGKVYVTQYLSTSSAIAVLDGTTLSLLDTLNPTITHTYLGDGDNGYSGIAIDPTGRLYLADQIYDNTTVSGQNTLYDRILVAQVPEPSTLVLVTCGLFALVAVRLRRRG